MRLACSILLIALMNGAIWLSGFDYDVRGDKAVGAYFLSILAAVSGWWIPSAIKAFKEPSP